MKILENWKDELTFLQQDPPPEKKTYEELISLYRKTGNEEYFEAFLHFYENRLNTKVMGFIQTYSMQGHFEDLKMVYVGGLYKAVREYDPSQGILFMAFKEMICRNEMHEYSRMMRTGYSVPSEYVYRKLRETMRLFNENGRKFTPEVIHMISEKTEMKEKLVKEVIIGGLRNENMADFYTKYLDMDDEEGAEDVTYDYSMNPERQFFLNYRGEAVMSAFDMLTPRQKNVLAARCGFCEHCYSKQEKKEFWKIAEDNNLASEESVKKIYKKAVKELEQELADTNYLYSNNKEFED